MTEPPLMNIAAAAEWLDIPKRTLEDIVRARKIAHTRIGKHVRFSMEQLIAYVKANEEPAIEPPVPLALRRIA